MTLMDLDETQQSPGSVKSDHRMRTRSSEKGSPGDDPAMKKLSALAGDMALSPTVPLTPASSSRASGRGKENAALFATPVQPSKSLSKRNGTPASTGKRQSKTTDNCSSKKNEKAVMQDSSSSSSSEDEASDEDMEGDENENDENKENIRRRVNMSSPNSDETHSTPKKGLSNSSATSRSRRKNSSSTNTRSASKSSEKKSSSDAKYRGAWTKEEDERLITIVRRRGASGWTAIAQELNTGRNGRQCRERWSNQINPDLVRSNWTEEEDAMILKLHGDVGNKWATIAKHLPGRTDNMVKNRYNGSLYPRQTREKRHSTDKKKSSRKVTPSTKNEAIEDPTSGNSNRNLVGGTNCKETSSNKRNRAVLEPQEEMLSPATRLYNGNDSIDMEHTGKKRTENKPVPFLELSSTETPTKKHVVTPKVSRLSPLSPTSPIFTFNESLLDTPRFADKGSKKNIFDFSPDTSFSGTPSKKKLRIHISSSHLDGEPFSFKNDLLSTKSLASPISNAPASPFFALKLSPAHFNDTFLVETPKAFRDWDFFTSGVDRKRKAATPLTTLCDEEEVAGNKPPRRLRVLRTKKRVSSNTNDDEDGNDEDAESLLGEDERTLIFKTPVSKKTRSALDDFSVEPLRTNDDFSSTLSLGTPTRTPTRPPFSPVMEELVRHYEEILSSTKKKSSSSSSVPASADESASGSQSSSSSSSITEKSPVKDGVSLKSRMLQEEFDLVQTPLSKTKLMFEAEPLDPSTSSMLLDNLLTPKSLLQTPISKAERKFFSGRGSVSEDEDEEANAAKVKKTEKSSETKTSGSNTPASGGIDLSRHAPKKLYGNLEDLVPKSGLNSKKGGSSLITPRSNASNDDSRSLGSRDPASTPRTSSSNASRDVPSSSRRGKSSLAMGLRASDEKWGVSDVPCKCKKTRCLKLYCTCFSSQNFCSSSCQCMECSNVEGNEKWKQVASSIPSRNSPGNRKDSPMCKCKNSMCLKKYCDCFRSGIRCGTACVCVDCHNTDEHMEKLASKNIFVGGGDSSSSKHRQIVPTVSRKAISLSAASTPAKSTSLDSSL